MYYGLASQGNDTAKIVERDHHAIVITDGIEINFSVMYHAEAFLGQMHNVSPSGLMMIISCRQRAAATHR